MSDTPLYIPQFHLRRFTDHEGILCIWDKITDRMLTSSPDRIEGETNSCLVTKLPDKLRTTQGLTQFSDSEPRAAAITEKWLEQLREISLGAQIHAAFQTREIISQYIALRYLISASKETLTVLAGTVEHNRSNERRTPWELNLPDIRAIFSQMAELVRESIWVFGRNSTTRPFFTSDSPIAFRRSDNAMWLRVGLAGSYIVFPLAHDIILYCYPKQPPWEKLTKFDMCLTPVELTYEMIESENSGQVFMASRFVISKSNDFTSARNFAKSIGTDRFVR